MSQRLIVRTEAEKDITDAAQWYEERSSGLSLRFRASLDRALSLIENNPELYAPVYRGLRRALLRRFPYGVFYVPHGDDIVVVGVLHTSRDPGLWEARLKAGVS